MLTAPAETTKTTNKSQLRVGLGRCKRGFSSRCEFAFIQSVRAAVRGPRICLKTSAYQQFLGQPAEEKPPQLLQLTVEKRQAVAQDRKTVARLLQRYRIVTGVRGKNYRYDSRDWAAGRGFRQGGLALLSGAGAVLRVDSPRISRPGCRPHLPALRQIIRQGITPVAHANTVAPQARVR